MSKLLAIIGSTASGKSDLALRLAEEFNTQGKPTEILSCDSLLVYRELNIGTAKPTAHEREEIQHHGIDLVNLDAHFTAGDYTRYATDVINDAFKRGVNILIVGGTGFYLKALLCGTWEAPPPNEEFRKTLDPLSDEELHGRLTKLDPEQALKIKFQDRYRTIRALEIIQMTGKSVTEISRDQKLQNPLPYPCPILGITRIRRDLERRITERTDHMFQHGLVPETKGLIAHYPIPPRSMHCVGYSEVIDHITGRMTLPECRERIIISTRQLAKKQMTFFKTFPKPIEWFALPTQEEDFLTAARNHFKTA